MEQSRPSNDGLVFKDRAFDGEALALIAEVVAAHRRLSRQELANTVCELLDWRRPGGGLKTWEAKELLATLEARGHITLPALRTTKPRGSRTSVPRTSAGESPGAPLRAKLDEVRPLVVRQVDSTEDRRLWRELLERHHPRGYRVPFGAHRRTCAGSSSSPTHGPPSWPACSSRARRGGSVPATVGSAGMTSPEGATSSASSTTAASSCCPGSRSPTSPATCSER